MSRQTPDTRFGMNRLLCPLDNGLYSWRHGLPIHRPMPLFLLRDGAIRRCSVVPEGLALASYTDRHQRRIHVVLDADSERSLLQAQPPRQAPTSIRSRKAAGQADQPLAA
ncbi:MAG: hypothetical protein ACKOYK_07950 [Cyanobium sp.]